MNLYRKKTARVAPRWYTLFLAVTSLVCLLPTLQTQAQKKEENLAYADLLFTQKEYAKAARQYQLFIKENPSSPNAQAGWFRLGECYLQVRQVKDATTTFQHIVDTYRGGAYVGSAAYRLAVLYFNSKNYPAAATNFSIAARELTSQEAKHQAKYYHARSLQFIEKFDEALKLYEEVIASDPNPKTNPFHERSLLESARIQFDRGKKAEASEFFKKLATTATTQSIKEEAVVRGGLIAAEMGQTTESEKLLNQAFDFPSTSPWKSLAQVGAIFNAFTRKDYDRVIAIYSSGALTTTIEEYRPKMLLIVGHSYRIKGDTQSATRLYELVAAKYPKTDEGMDAGYRKLQILYQQGSPSLVSNAVRYISALKKRNPEDPYIDMAYLMKAEYHFGQAERSMDKKNADLAKLNYREAAMAYGEVREANVEERFHPIRLYKQGWAYLEAGELKEGILAISRFIKRFPDNALTPSALAKRGTTYQSVEDFTFAQTDYQTIIDKYPNSPELELAMQQKALIYAHKRDLPKMIVAYEELLKRFPNTKGKAEATYWIGVGHFDLERYAKAIPPLEAAKKLNPDAFGQKASIRLILAHYQLEQIAELTKAAREYIESGIGSQGDKQFPIPKPVLEYLGKRLAKDRNYPDAEFFLTHLSTPADPQKTTASVWKVLGDARMKVKKYADAVKAFDSFLAVTDEPALQGYGYLEKGKALLLLKQFREADESATECMKRFKQGEFNAQARELRGDIAAAQGELESAVKHYLITSQIFDHPVITPRVLTKAINVYLSLGEQGEADNLRKELQANYPDYRE